MYILAKQSKPSIDSEVINYTVTDTKDGVTDVFELEEIREALQLGIKILGLELTKENKVRTTDDMCYVHREAYTGMSSYWYQEVLDINCNNKGYVVLFNKIKYDLDRKELSIYTNDKLYFSITLRIDENFDGIECYKYKGKDVLVITVEHYDKHYYSEDNGKLFFKQYLVYNGKLLGLTKYNEDVGDNDFDLEDDLVTLKSNKVVFNGKKVIIK